MQLSFDPTSPSTIGNMELIAAFFGSFTMVRFSGARVAARLVTPGRTGDTDKKKQRGEFHIHIAKLVTRTLQQIGKIGNENIPEVRMRTAQVGDVSKH